MKKPGILGGMRPESTLMFSSDELPVPAFNTMKYHIAGIVRYMLG